MVVEGEHEMSLRDIPDSHKMLIPRVAGLQVVAAYDPNQGGVEDGHERVIQPEWWVTRSTPDPGCDRDPATDKRLELWFDASKPETLTLAPEVLDPNGFPYQRHVLGWQDISGKGRHAVAVPKYAPKLANFQPFFPAAVDMTVPCAIATPESGENAFCPGGGHYSGPSVSYLAVAGEGYVPEYADDIHDPENPTDALRPLGTWTHFRKSRLIPEYLTFTTVYAVLYYVTEEVPRVEADQPEWFTDVPGITLLNWEALEPLIPSIPGGAENIPPGASIAIIGPGMAMQPLFYSEFRSDPLENPEDHELVANLRGVSVTQEVDGINSVVVSVNEALNSCGPPTTLGFTAPTVGFAGGGGTLNSDPATPSTADAMTGSWTGDFKASPRPCPGCNYRYDATAEIRTVVTASSTDPIEIALPVSVSVDPSGWTAFAPATQTAATSGVGPGGIPISQCDGTGQSIYWPSTPSGVTISGTTGVRVRFLGSTDPTGFGISGVVGSGYFDLPAPTLSIG